MGKIPKGKTIMPKSKKVKTTTEKEQSGEDLSSSTFTTEKGEFPTPNEIALMSADELASHYMREAGVTPSTDQSTNMVDLPRGESRQFIAQQTYTWLEDEKYLEHLHVKQLTTLQDAVIGLLKYPTRSKTKDIFTAINKIISGDVMVYRHGLSAIDGHIQERAWGSLLTSSPTKYLCTNSEDDIRGTQNSDGTYHGKRSQWMKRTPDGKVSKTIKELIESNLQLLKLNPKTKQCDLVPNTSARLWEIFNCKMIRKSMFHGNPLFLYAIEEYWRKVADYHDLFLDDINNYTDE